MEALDLIHRAKGSDDYVFKQALVRDALYNGLLSGPRTALHLKVAEELERRRSNRLKEVAETLAHHYAATARADKAFGYPAMAGDKSFEVYAIPEAEQYFRRALEVFEKDSACANQPYVVRVIVRLLAALHFNADVRNVGLIARKFMPLIRQAGETTDLVIAYYYQAFSLLWNLELRASHELSAEAVRVAGRLCDARARSYVGLGLFLARIALGLDSLDAADRMKAGVIEDALFRGHPRPNRHQCIHWSGLHVSGPPRRNARDCEKARCIGRGT